MYSISSAQIDAEIQAANEQAAKSLQEIFESDDPEEAILANPSLIDEFFLNVLGTNMKAAEQSGRVDDAEKLRRISEIIMELIEESQPPEIQFINRLLTAEYPDSTQALLEENRLMIDAELLELMQVVGQDLTTGGREELGQRLAQIQNQAVAMLEPNP
jgi:hypothetical protein